MSSVPVVVANNIAMDSNQSPARRGYYGSSPSRRHHDSGSDASYSDRPLLQSAHATPCHRRHYDACPSEAHWSGRDGAQAVVHRIKASSSSTAAAPPPSTVDDDDKNIASSSSRGGCGPLRFHSQAQMVDVMSRILFPCMFLIFNIIYWPYYLFFCAP